MIIVIKNKVDKW